MTSQARSTLSLQVLLHDQLVGSLTHRGTPGGKASAKGSPLAAPSQGWLQFSYAPEWLERADAVPLSWHLPLQDKPLSGSGSEAAAINDHNMVVGWRDSRHQTQPVVNGTNRMQEAFLLNAAAPSNSWYLNDLICGKDDAGNKQCAQNGKYYHIAYASGISSDGTIAATAYRYDSESDLNKRANATVAAPTF